MRQPRFLVAAFAVLVVALLATCPLEAQKIPGIGVPGRNGARIYVLACPEGTNTAPILNTAGKPFDPYDYAGFTLRYGDCRATGGRFLVDAETILGRGSIALREACLCDRFGTLSTHDCHPTMTELHDYWATNSQGTNATYFRTYSYVGSCKASQGGGGGTPASCGDGKPDAGEFCKCQVGDPNCIACPQDLPPGSCDPPPPPPEVEKWGDLKCGTNEAMACKSDCPTPPSEPCPAGTACREEPPKCRPPYEVTADCLDAARKADAWPVGVFGRAKQRVLDKVAACMRAAAVGCNVRP